MVILVAGVDNTAAINAAISAASGPDGGGTVRLPRGSWPIAGRVDITNGMTLVGHGGGGAAGYGGTELLCTTSGAGVDITDSGGGIRFLEINGDDVADYPLKEHTGADRILIGVDVHNAVLDNWTTEFVQNSNYIGCTSHRAGRDALVLDKECGGLIYTRFNAADAGRYPILIQQSVSPTTAYTTPTHIRFDHAILERPVADYPLLNITSAFNVNFVSPIFAGGSVQTSAPLVSLTSAGFVSIGSAEFFGDSVANQAAITTGTGTSLSIDGTAAVINVPYFLDAPDGTVSVNGSVSLNGNTFATAGTPGGGDIAVTHAMQAAIASEKTTTGGQVLRGRVTTETGERFRLLADGTLSWGDGSDYTFGTSIFRRSDGKVGVTGGLVVDTTLQHTGSAVGFHGTTAISKPTVTGSRGSNAALTSLLTQLAAYGLIVDSTSPTPTTPGVRVYAASTGQTIATGADAAIDLTTTEFNDDTGLFVVNLTNNTIQVTPAGLLLLTWEVSFTGGGSGERDSYITKGSGTLVRDEIRHTIAGEYARSSGSAIVRAAAGDTFKLNAYVDGGSTVSIVTTTANETGLGVAYLGT